MTKEIDVMTRCVHIFPRFERNHVIEEIRKEHDTLYGCIEPHLTLVFPFESALVYEEIKADLDSLLINQAPIHLKAKGVEGIDSHGYYLFLNIVKGQESLKKLHYKLHEGILAPYQSPWTKDGSFVPHITVGRFQTKEAMLKAADLYKTFEESFTVVADRLYVEIIGEDEASIIEGEILLND